MLSWWRKKSTEAVPSHEKQPIYHWSDDEIPRYPPFMKGLPTVPPEKLLETQSELIDRIADTAIATPEIIGRYYLPAVRRFASYAHLLPASQSHHHRGAGGLLRHSIEVGLWALQSADKVLLESAKSPSQRREMEPRWQLAVFLAALCHDAGKPVTDLVVTNRDRTAVWKPIKEDLFTWASKHHVQAYFLDWREGRARQHTALSNLIGDRIIGAETLDWIEEGGTELIVWLMESLTSNPGPANPIYDLVIKADQTSVERDLKTLGVAMAGYDLGVPVERHLTDIMRRFIKEGMWLVNEPGARVWNIDGNLYLIWPAAGEEIARQVREDGIPGIPRTPDGILDMLLERQIAFVREDAATGDRLWKIAPAVLVEKIPEIKLPAIRLRDEAMVSTIPITPVAGRILNDAHSNQTVEAEPRTSQVVVEAEAISQEPASTEVAQPNDEGSVTEGSKAIQSRPIPKDKPMQSPRQTPNPIALDGAVGEALRALAQDLKSGDKRWGWDAVIDPQQQLLLRWPDAFSGYGLTVKMILDELAVKEWLWVDPMTPLKRVLDVELNGLPTKAIRLVRELTPMFISESGGESHNLPGTAADIAPPSLSSSGNDPSTAITRKREAKSGREDSTSASKPKKRNPGKGDASGTPVAAIKPDESTSMGGDIERVIHILAEANREEPVDLDGWITIAKYQAMSQFKSAELSVSLGLLGKLSKAHPDRLVMVGGKIRFR
ncbi:MAG: MobH family relaxase [Pseudomonadota bacterium]